MSDDTARKNKELVLRLYRDTFETKTPRLAVLDEIVHENYVQHNPKVGPGREGLRQFILDLAPVLASIDFLKEKPLFVNVVAEGDLVIRQEVREDWMLVDIFRVENGWLVEHWDAFRPHREGVTIPGLY